MKIVKCGLKLLIAGFISITFLLSCEKDGTDIGSDLIPDKSRGNTTYVDLIAYNVSNNDTIRADYATLKNGLVGVYEDNVFGKSQASFDTQIRLSASDEIQGTVQEVDSVVLAIYPVYNSSISTVKKVTLSNGNIRYTTKYPLASTACLGNKGTTMGINVNRIDTYLETTASQFYSNKSITVTDLLGTVTIGDSATSVVVKTADGSVVSGSTTPGYRIKLDANYFKQNFFNKKGSAELSDNSQFVQYFKGIRISPSSDVSSFMFNFPKQTMTLVAYYRYKNNAGDTSYTSTSYKFTMGSSDNSVVGEYNFYNRSTASSQFKQQVQSPDKTSGESQLFLQGMGGPSINIKLDDTQMEAIRDSVQNKGWAVVGAKLNFYLAEDAVSKPDYIYGYDLTKKSFLPDLTSSGYSFNPVYDFSKNPGYYTLNITQYVKNIVEKNASNDEILVGMGNFSTNSSGAYIGYYRTSRAYQPFRLIFYGNKAVDDKKLRLEITYGKN